MTTPGDHDGDWEDRWSRRSDGEIADAWISYQSKPVPQLENDEDWWAVSALMDLAHDDPARALEIVFLVGRTSNNPRVLEMLGASPLEDLLSEDSTFFDFVAVEAHSSPNLRRALKSVWQSTIPDHIWAALQRLAD